MGWGRGGWLEVGKGGTSVILITIKKKEQSFNRNSYSELRFKKIVIIHSTSNAWVSLHPDQQGEFSSPLTGEKWFLLISISLTQWCSISLFCFSVFFFLSHHLFWHFVFSCFICFSFSLFVCLIYIFRIFCSTSPKLLHMSNKKLVLPQYFFSFSSSALWLFVGTFSSLFCSCMCLSDQVLATWMKHFWAVLTLSIILLPEMQMPGLEPWGQGLTQRTQKSPGAWAHTPPSLDHPSTPLYEK